MSYFFKYEQIHSEYKLIMERVARRVWADYGTSCTEEIWADYPTSCTQSILELTIQWVARSRFSGITMQRVAQANIQTKREKPAAPQQGGRAGNTRNTRAKYKSTRAKTNTRRIRKYVSYLCIYSYLGIWGPVFLYYKTMAEGVLRACLGLGQA